MAKVLGVIKMNVLLVIFAIINISCFVEADYHKIEQYEPNSALPDITSSAYVVKLREKRQSSDQKNQYLNANESSAQAAGTVEMANAKSAIAANATMAVDSSIVVNYNASEQRLLGENGTGQRRYSVDDLTKQQQPMVIATTSATDNINATKSNLSAVLGMAETSVEKLADKVDVPENETLTEIGQQGLNINQTTDYHNYYNSTIYINKAEASKIWQVIHNSSHNSMLSQAHRRAMTVELTFDFPFYGHPVRNITVATGGFLYTGEYVHSWLAATQYIAPLMANFDTSISNDSFVRLNDNGTAFTVLWENVSLQDKPNVGKFTFSTTLHKNGDITFTYFSVPILVNSIQDDKHPVKVGLSDAYIIDKVVFFARRKTIYEYHRVNFASVEITNSTIIRLTALPTCLTYTDCAACIEHETSFDCSWCPVMNRCSSGTDRRKQEWMHRGCDRMQITEMAQCPALGTKGNNGANPNATYTDYTLPGTSNTNNKNNHNNNINENTHEINNEPHDEQHGGDDNYHSLVNPSNNNNAAAAAVSKAAASPSIMNASDESSKHKTMGVAMGVIVPIALVSILLAWVAYAYRHPHTKSGQLLIQYRPSAWSWRRGEARYTAATIHM